jgi:diguanylate cyclase (GGDEF)-like protein/PAS domain S-box-containing protein
VLPESRSRKALILGNDHSSFLSSLKKELILQGFQIYSYDDPNQSWTFFAEELPGLIVLDSLLEDRFRALLRKRMREHPLGRYLMVLQAEPASASGMLRMAIDNDANHFLDLKSAMEDLPGLIAWAGRMADNLGEIRQSHQKIGELDKELKFLNVQLEEALTRANKLAVETELAYLELDQIFKTAAGGILVVDKEFNVLRHNEAFLQTARLGARELRGKKCFEIFPVRLCHTSECPLERILRGRSRTENEVEIPLPDGSLAHLMVTSTPLRGPEADFIAIVASITDITARVVAERGLRKSEEQFRLVVEKAPFGQIIVGPSRNVEYVNPKFSEIFGYTLEDLPDEKTWVRGAYDERGSGKDIEATRPPKRKQNAAGTYWVVCRDGSEKIVTIEDVDLGTDRKVVTYVDATDRVRAQEALLESKRKYRQLSMIDELTGLYNRRHLDRILKAETNRTRRHGRPLALLLLDIDDFKDYNDTFGHPKGDQVLATMGKIISGSIRRSDSGFRYGGEEFVVLMPETPGHATVLAAERIRKRFESVAFTPVPGRTVRKTASMGVAEYLPGEAETDFLARADQNMYLAKRMGKNRVFFSQS